LNLNQEKPIIKTKEDEILSKELRQSVNDCFFSSPKHQDREKTLRKTNSEKDVKSEDKITDNRQPQIIK
jgi:hypothetical protein